MELPRIQYSHEFRKGSVKFFKESELTQVEAAKRLSLPKGTLKNWVYADKRGELATVGKHQKLLTELELELSGVKWELAEVKMESGFHAQRTRLLCKRKRENTRLEIEILADHGVQTTPYCARN